MASNTHGLWAETACPAPATRALDRNLQVDVAVIGAGYTGLSTALHLAEDGPVSVVVLEAADIGFGASGRNAGMVNAGAWIEPDELPRRLGPEYGARLLARLGEGPGLVYEIIRRYGIPCDAHQNGNLHCAIGARGLASIQRRAGQWRRHGVEVQLLDAEETARLVGTRAYEGALLDPRTGTVQPLGYVRGLAQAALSQGAQLFTRTAVTAARRDGGPWRLNTSTGHEVVARQVVVASNTRQAAGPDAWPQLQTELVRMPYFNVATQPLPEPVRRRILPGGRGAFDTATILSSYRLDGTGRLVYGSVGAVGDGSRDAHADWVRRAIGRLFPELKGMALQHRWYGWIDSTAHHLPCLHQLAPGVWSLSGYNGRGIGAGTILGRELAKMLLGQIGPEDMPLPVTELRPTGFRGLKERFYRGGAALAHALAQRC